MKVVLEEKEIAEAVRLWLENEDLPCPQAIKLRSDGIDSANPRFFIDCLYEGEQP